MIAIVEVRGGVAEITQGDALIVDWDHLNAGDEAQAEWLYEHPMLPGRIKSELEEMFPDLVEEEEDEKTYKIVRFRFQSDEKPVIRTGLTLEEAQEHCSREDTHGDGWFDGYYEET